ncbi:MAG: DinB family protein [Vicinamibacterales bacterium]
MRPVNVRELLIEPVAYIGPARALEGLGASDAERRPGVENHSVADIVAHLMFWQDWFVERCQGTSVPMAQRAAIGWPAVPDGTWPDLRERFLTSLARAAALAEPASRLDDPIFPAIEFPPLARHTIRDALVHIATHNAHHLGQVIVLRQTMGCWPPPSGSYVW